MCSRTVNSIEKVKVTQSCQNPCDPMYCNLPGSSVHGISPGKNTGVGGHFLLQRILPNQDQSWVLLHCGQILYCLSHQGKPSSIVSEFNSQLEM